LGAKKLLIAGEGGLTRVIMPRVVPPIRMHRKPYSQRAGPASAISAHACDLGKRDDRTKEEGEYAQSTQETIPCGSAAMF